MSLSRSILNSLLPQGAFWTPAAGDDYDNLLNGIAENSESMYQVLKQLAYIRDPFRTTMLSDMEKEYGIYPHFLDTEKLRRERLAALMFRRGKIPTVESLQEKLRESGFTGAYVYANTAPLDPADLLKAGFNMTAGDILPGGNDPQCGEPEAVCVQFGGELIVNGDLYSMIPDYINLCGDGIECGVTVQAGDFLTYGEDRKEITYPIPTDPGYWPMFFIVSGEVLTDAFGTPTTYKFLSIPRSRRLEFRRLILRFKPVHAWGVLMITWT